MKLKENKKNFFYETKNHECLRMLNHNLSFENWHSGNKAVNVDEAYDNLFDVFMKHYNTPCPIVNVVHKN